MSNLCKDWSRWAGNMGKGECCFTGKSSTGSLELHERKGSRKGPKCPRRTLVGERAD